MFSSSIHPIAATLGRANQAHEWLSVAHADSGVPAHYVRCADVDSAGIAQWEARAAEGNVKSYGRSHPMAATAYVLGWYADIAATVGALCFLLDRRVPHLGREAVAFRRHAEEHYPDAVAVLTSSFWCLPDDPAANHPDATVVPDEEALAAVLRGQVRAHADDFLADYRPGAKLPRRNLLGAFFDGLDGGFWLYDSPLPTPQDEFVAAARSVLPGSTTEFAEASRFRTVVDGKGRQHLTRCRVSCCYYYKVSATGEACTTCPRTDDAERLERLSVHADEVAAAG